MTDKWYTHTCKPVCEYMDVTVLQNQEVSAMESYGKKPRCNN
jgi:hypothetical protein